MIVAAKKKVKILPAGMLRVVSAIVNAIATVNKKIEKFSKTELGAPCSSFLGTVLLFF